MSGYTPVFKSVFTGTLSGRWPDTGLWLCLLGLADKNGELDYTPQYISMVTGLELVEVEGCLARFMEPDPMSRSQDHDGRRLVLTDAPRPWGWRIVNFHHYREKARLAAKNAREVEEGKNRERMEHRRSPPLTADDRPSPPPTDPSNANANSNSDTSSLRSDVVAPALESPAKKKKTPSRIPEDFDPGEAGREYTRKALPNVDVEAFIEEFRDYWSAAAGPTSRKLDWLAAYRVRVRNCTRYPTLPAAAQVPAKVVRYDYRGNVIP